MVPLVLKRPTSPRRVKHLADNLRSETLSGLVFFISNIVFERFSGSLIVVLGVYWCVFAAKAKKASRKG